MKGPLQSLKGPGGTSAVAEWFCNMRLQRQTCKSSTQRAFHKARMKPPSEHDMLLGLLASLLVSGSNTSRFLGQIWFIRRALHAPEDTGWASAEPRATPKTSQRKTVMASNHTLPLHVTCTNSQSRIKNLMQLQDTVACLTRSGLLANSIRYQSAVCTFKRFGTRAVAATTLRRTNTVSRCLCFCSALACAGPRKSKSSWRRFQLDWLSAREASCRWTLVKFC